MEKELQKKTLDTFFRKEYLKLVNFIRKNLDDRYYDASPEDIIQDVALGLIDRLDLDASIGNMAGYIYRAVKNRIIDYQQKKQRTVSIERFADNKNGNNLLDSIADEPATRDTDYLDTDPELLHHAISQLRPDEQAVMIATEFEQRTFEELSAEWGIPLGTLLSRKHRALSKLHTIIINNQK